VSSRKPNKVIILGLDAGTLEDLSNPKLATVQRLIRDGASGHLRSTTPPSTPPSWSSILSGVNPGRHNVFTFVKRDNRLTTAFDKAAPELWDYIGPVIAQGIPFTYPVRPMPHGGVFLSGHLAPQKLDARAVWPSSVLRDLKKWGWHPATFTGRPPTVMVDTMRRSADLFFHLLESYPWRVAFIVWPEFDHCAHFHYDQRHLLYQAFDSILQEILLRWQGDVGIMVISDHGACPVTHDFVAQRFAAYHGIRAKIGGWGDWYFEDEAERDRARELLEALEWQGRKAIDTWTPAEIYHGPYTGVNMWDLRVWPRRELGLSYTLASARGILSEFFVPCITKTGCHHPDGVLIMRGPGVTAGQRIEGATVYDILPTLLDWLGEPVPEGLDGKVVKYDR